MNNKNDSLPETMLDASEEEQIVSALEAYAEEEGEALLRLNEELSNLPEYQLSPKTKRRFRRILHRNIPVQKQFARRAVLLIAALLTALLLTCTALGHGLFDFLLREFSGYAAVSNDLSNSNGTNHHCVWGDVPVPAYLPSGYQYSLHEDSGQTFTIEFMDDVGNTITFSRYTGSSQLLIDTEEIDQQTPVEINGLKGTLFSKNGFFNLVWGSNPLFQITGGCDLDELIKMAQSVAVSK